MQLEKRQSSIPRSLNQGPPPRSPLGLGRETQGSPGAGSRLPGPRGRMPPPRAVPAPAGPLPARAPTQPWPWVGSVEPEPAGERGRAQRRLWAGQSPSTSSIGAGHGGHAGGAVHAGSPARRPRGPSASSAPCRGEGQTAPRVCNPPTLLRGGRVSSPHRNPGWRRLCGCWPRAQPGCGRQALSSGGVHCGIGRVPPSVAFALTFALPSSETVASLQP